MPPPRGDFVCVLLTWPAGGSRGALMGYNVDRESGEFAVADMRKAIRAIGQTEGVRGVHIIAHSRGTDVLAKRRRLYRRHGPTNWVRTAHHKEMAENQRLRSDAPRRQSPVQPTIASTICRAVGRKGAFAAGICFRR